MEDIDLARSDQTCRVHDTSYKSPKKRSAVVKGSGPSAHDPSSPDRIQALEADNLVTPKGQQASPTVPLSDFQVFAESLLSPLTPIDGVVSHAGVPTSREWEAYQVHAGNHFAADFVSTKRRPDDCGCQFSPAQLGASSPAPCSHNDGVADCALGDIPHPEGFVAIDNTSQAQLFSNAQALASRLTKGKVDGASGGGTIAKRYVPEAEASLVDCKMVKNIQRKKRKMDSHIDNSKGSLRAPEKAHTMDQLKSLLLQGGAPNSLNVRERVSGLSGESPIVLSENYGAIAEFANSHRSPLPAAQPFAFASLTTEESPMATRANEAPNISPAFSQVGSRSLSCNCKKSRCLKLYCDCFRAQKYCDGCNCQQCANDPDHESERLRSMVSITERNPEAFKPRITSDSPKRHAGGLVGASKSNVSPTAVQYHFSGCHCKKSACLKKYCECYQAQIPCQARCRCQDCKNTAVDGIFTDVAPKNLIARSPVFTSANGGVHSFGAMHVQSIPNALVQGLVRAAGARVSEPVQHASNVYASSMKTRQPLVQRHDSLIVRQERQPTPLSNTDFTRAETANKLGVQYHDPQPPQNLLRGYVQSPCKPSNGDSLISPLSSEISPYGSVNSSGCLSTKTISSSGASLSNVSVDVLTAVLAARLRDAGSLGGSGVSPEECIRESLLLMQQQGIILSSHQDRK